MLKLNRQVSTRGSSVQQRRTLLLSGAGAVLGSMLCLQRPAAARDLKEAQQEKEARRSALRDAAKAAQSTGRDKAEVFAMPEYSVSEEARTPNVHSRQNEGARSQENV